MLQLTFNPGLTLTGFRTTRPSSSLNLLFSDVPVDVVVLLNSIIFRCKMSVKYSFQKNYSDRGGMYGRGGEQKLFAIRIQSSSEINLETESR